MVPVEVVAEVFGGDASMRAQEGLEPFMAAVSGLDMEVTTDVLSGRLVQHLMGDLHLGSAGCESLSAIGDEEGVLRQDRFEDSLDGVAIGSRQDGSDGGAATIDREKYRHEFVREPAFARFSATFSGFAVWKIGDGLALFRAFPVLRTFAAGQHEGFVGFDDAAQHFAGGLRRLKKPVTPAKRSAVGHPTAVCRLVDRFPLRKRLAEGEPLVLVPQPRQRRRRQCVET